MPATLPATRTSVQRVWADRAKWGMATLEYDDHQLRLVLSPWEKAGALRGDVVVPRSAIRSVRVTGTPLDEINGLRMPGTHVPGRITLGTYGGRNRTFAAAYNKPGVVIELEGERYGRLVVTVDDPEQVAADLHPR